MAHAAAYSRRTPSESRSSSTSVSATTSPGTGGAGNQALLPAHLARLGYETALVGKLHVGVRHGYYASVAFFDRQVGRILAELERRGLAHNTLVLFVSDHGDMIGDYELITKGAYFYDPCTRVPMILRLPEGELAGTRVAELVQPHDLAATLLRAAGMPADGVTARMPESQDLEALARGQVAAPRDHALTMYRNSGYGNRGYWDPPIYGTMYHDGRYKLSLFHDPAARAAPEGELYDLDADPGETANLWADPRHAARRTHLTDRLHATLVASEVHHVAGRGGTSWPPGRS